MSETKSISETPARRLVVSDEARPFVSRGGRIFSRQVVEEDADIAEGQEVLVTDRDGRVLARAMAFLTPKELQHQRRHHALSPA
ncbi:MAG: hypothetical protein GKC10_03010 [Methanosarcinales archaeon]|nr:hypothetical protein [Methanosarcinales archaeon]